MKSYKVLNVWAISVISGMAPVMAQSNDLDRMLTPEVYKEYSPVGKELCLGKDCSVDSNNCEKSTSVGKFCPDYCKKHLNASKAKKIVKALKKYFSENGGSTFEEEVAQHTRFVVYNQFGPDAIVLQRKNPITFEYFPEANSIEESDDDIVIKNDSELFYKLHEIVLSKNALALESEKIEGVSSKLESSVSENSGALKPVLGVVSAVAPVVVCCMKWRNEIESKMFGLLSGFAKKIIPFGEFVVPILSSALPGCLGLFGSFLKENLPSAGSFIKGKIHAFSSMLPSRNGLQSMGTRLLEKAKNGLQSVTSEISEGAKNGLQSAKQGVQQGTSEITKKGLQSLKTKLSEVSTKLFQTKNEPEK